MVTCESWGCFSSALATPAIAAIALLIAWRQWLTARNRLKFDLFTRRLEIYESAQRFLSSIRTNGRVPSGADIQFLRETRSARWLFGEPFHKYLEESVYFPAIRLDVLDKVFSTLTMQAEREANIKEQTRITEQLGRVMETDLNVQASKFLQLAHA
jgi:hypothetical protein